MLLLQTDQVQLGIHIHLTLDKELLLILLLQGIKLYVQQTYLHRQLKNRLIILILLFIQETQEQITI